MVITRLEPGHKKRRGEKTATVKKGIQTRGSTKEGKKGGIILAPKESLEKKFHGMME